MCRIHELELPLAPRPTMATDFDPAVVGWYLEPQVRCQPNKIAIAVRCDSRAHWLLRKAAGDILQEVEPQPVLSLQALQ